MKLFSQVAHAASLRVLAAGCGVAFTALTARLLGPEGRGEIATLIALSSGIGVFLHLSLAQVAVQRIGAAIGDAKRSESQMAFGVLALVMAAGTALTGLGLALWMVAGQPGSRHFSLPTLWLGLALVPFVIWEAYSSLLLGAIGRLAADSKAIFLGKFVALAAGGLLLAMGAGVNAVLCAMLAGGFVNLWLTLAVLVRELGTPRLASWRRASAYFRDGMKLHLNAIAGYASVGVDVLIVAALASLGSTGIYQLGAQIVGALLIIPASMGAVFYSRNATHGHLEAWREKRKLVFWSVPAFALLALCLYHTSSTWIGLLFGPEFMQLSNLIGIQLMTFVGLAFSHLMIPQWIARGLFKTLAAMSLALAIFSVVMNLLLVPMLGNAGAAIVRLGWVVITATAHIYMFWRCDREMKLAAYPGSRQAREHLP